MDSNHPFWRLPASFAVQAAQYACLGRPYLCRKHKRVLTKFDDASELALPEYLYHGTLTFGTHLITTPKRCSLCSLLEPIIHAKQDGEYYIGSLPGYSVVLCYLLSEQERLLVAESSSERSMMIIQVTRRVIKPKRRLNWLFSINTKSNLCPYTPEARQRMIAPATTYGDYISQGKPLTARVLNRYQASFAEIKHWLLECQTHHGCRCSLSLEARLTAFAAAVTTIDCQLLRLVVLPRGQPYIALSYVWGPRQRHHRKPTSYGRFALSTCPRTIQDAIAVTRSLGYRYLWVDKYCIDQHNEKEKAHQLDMMDQIYEKADLTIVAAAGCDDTYGLPGAGRHSMRPRTRQSVARLENHAFISCDLPILDILSSTQWFRRGWTFQEMKLSTRCLFFLESQAILACRTTTYYEEFPHLPGSSSASPILPSILSDIQGGLSFLQLEIQITEYLGRTLSYEADALNAFKGLLNRAWYFSYWGISLVIAEANLQDAKQDGASQNNVLSNIGHRVEDPKNAFLRGLGWFHDTPLVFKKKECMPSWSWVSLESGDQFHLGQDPDGASIKDVNGRMHRLAIPDTRSSTKKDEVHVQVLQDHEGREPSWIEFSHLEYWKDRKVIPEGSPLLKLNGPVVDIETIDIGVGNIWEAGFGPVSSTKDYVHTTTEPLKRFRAYFDHLHLLPDVGKLFKDPFEHNVRQFSSTGWKLLYVHNWVINSDTHVGNVPCHQISVFLIIRPRGMHWERIGLATRIEDIGFQQWPRETIVLR